MSASATTLFARHLSGLDIVSPPRDFFFFFFFLPDGQGLTHISALPAHNYFGLELFGDLRCSINSLDSHSSSQLRHLGRQPLSVEHLSVYIREVPNDGAN